MKELLKIFLMFCRIGGLTFGGGYAMMPMLQKELADTGKMTTEEITDYYALGQCAPGIIAVNTAAFVGHHLRGVAGALAAALGVITPSFVIILVIAVFISNFSHIQWVQHALAGVRIAVAALVVNAVIKMWKSGVKDWIGVILCIAGFVVSAMTKISPIWVVVGSALVGVAVHSMKLRREAKR